MALLICEGNQPAFAGLDSPRAGFQSGQVYGRIPVEEPVRRKNGRPVKYLKSLVGPAGLEPATRPL